MGDNYTFWGVTLYSITVKRGPGVRGEVWLPVARWRTVASNAMRSPAASPRTTSSGQQSKAKLMQQQWDYRHPVDFGDYFLIEMMTNPPSSSVQMRRRRMTSCWRWRWRRGRKPPRWTAAIKNCFARSCSWRCGRG